VQRVLDELEWLPNKSSFGAGGKSSISSKSAMKSTWLPRSSGFTPFFVAVTMSPST
jgi:hypothetical protein